MKPESSTEKSRNQELVQSLLGPISASSRSLNGVGIEEMKPGSGKAAKSGDRVKVYYIGRLKSNNKIFDSSTKRPFSFRLGRSEVISGWDIGIVGKL